jgi:hypothetical protein
MEENIKLYIQLDDDNYIVNWSNVEDDNFIEITSMQQLPVFFDSGCYKYISDGNYELNEEKQELLTLKELNCSLDQYLLEELGE